MDRQAFKQRMQQYKTYKEQNPDKGYWDWKVQAYDKAGETGQSDEDKRITAAINQKRAEALERSRTRTHGVLPTVNGRPNPLSREQWEQLRVQELNKVKEELDELKGNKHSPLFYNALLTEGDFHPIETREARLKQLEEAVYPLTINGEIGPGCLYTATSNYGGKYGYASNPDFESRPASVTGFKRVPTDSVQPGDIVIRHDDNGGRHAMVFDSKDANGNWLYNHSNGGAEVSDYRHLGKYPSRKDQLHVYRFTGTHQDSINWVKSYRPGGETGKSERSYEDWKGKIAKYKGIDVDHGDYDYRRFYYENPDEAYAMLNNDPNAHFTDKYKTPTHPTFSDESIYSNSNTPGGHWSYRNGHDVYEFSDYTMGHSDETLDYLRYSDPGVIATYKGSTVLPSATAVAFRRSPATPHSRGNYVAASDNTRVVRPEIVEPIKREHNPYNSPGGHEAVISADTRTAQQVQQDRQRAKQLDKQYEKAKRQEAGTNALMGLLTMTMPSTYIGAAFNDNGQDYWDNVISGEGFGNSALNFLTDLIAPLAWGKVAKGANLAKGATQATTNGMPMMDAVSASGKGISQKLKNKFANSMLNLALNSRGAGLVADVLARPRETVRAIAGKRYLLTNKQRQRYLQDVNMAEILERVRRKNVEDLDYRTKLYPTRDPVFNSVRYPTQGGTYSSDEADILFNDDPLFEEYFLEDNSLGVMPSDAPTPFVRGNKYLMSNIAFPTRDLRHVGAHEMQHKMQQFRMPDLEAGMIDPVYGYYKIPDSNVLPTNWTYKKLGRSEIWDPVLFSRLYSPLDQNYAQLSQLKANSSDWWRKRWASSPNEVNSEMMGLRAVDDLPRFGEMTAEQQDKVVDFMADRFYLDKNTTRSMLQKLSDAGYKRGGEVTGIPTYKYAGESKDNKDLPDGDITFPSDNTRVTRPEIVEPLEASYDGKKWSEMTPQEQLNVRVHGHTASTPTEEGLKTVSPEFEALSWARTLAIMADLGIGKAAQSAIKKKSVSGSASKSNFANDMLKQKQQFVQKAINNGQIEAVGGPSEVNNFLATPTSTVKVVPKSGTPTDNYLNWLHDRFNIDPVREGTVAGSYSFPKRVVGGFDTRRGEVWLNAKYPDRIARTLVHEGGSHGTDDAVRNMLVRNVKQSKDELPTWLTEYNADPRVYQVYKRIANIRPDIKTAIQENIKNHKYNPFKLHKINKYSDSSKWYEARATLNETRNNLFDSWWSVINALPNSSNYNIRSAIIDLQDDPGLVNLISRINGYGSDYRRAYNLLSPQKQKEWMDMVRFALKELPVVAPLAVPQLLKGNDQNATEEVPAYEYAGETKDDDITTQQADNTRVAKPQIVEPIERTYNGRRWSELTPQEQLNVQLRGSTSSTPTEKGLGPVIKLEDIINMTPLGNIMALKDMFNSAVNNDWLGAGLAALGFLPFVPKGLRRAKSVKRPTPTVNPNYVGDKLEEKFSQLGVDAEQRAKFANEQYRVVERMMEDPAYLDRAEAVRKQFGDNYPMAYADAFMAYNTDPKSLPRIKVTDDIDSYGSMQRLPDGSYLYSRSKSINQPHNPEHELGHFVDMLKSGTSDAEFGNRMYMQMRKDLRSGIDTYDGYFANPTEQKAHMNQLREWMFRNGIITTRGQKVTTGELKKALKQAGNVRGMEGVERASKQFKDIKTYTKWFNTVPLVSVDKNNDNTAIV